MDNEKLEYKASSDEKAELTFVSEHFEEELNAVIGLLIIQTS